MGAYRYGEIKQCLLDVRHVMNDGTIVIKDSAIDGWRLWLPACVQAKGVAYTLSINYVTVNNFSSAINNISTCLKLEYDESLS